MKNYYFTNFHEEAIREYVKSDDLSFKNSLYTKSIHPVFQSLVEGILSSKKFTELQLSIKKEIYEELPSFMFIQLHLFDPARGSKAYSYFTTLCYNFIITKITSSKISTNSIEEVPHLDEEFEIVDEEDDSSKFNRAVESAKRILPEHQWVIFKEYFVHDKTYAEISKSYGVSKNVVFSIIRSARKKVREDLNITAPYLKLNTK